MMMKMEEEGEKGGLMKEVLMKRGVLRTVILQEVRVAVR